jgi:hypothetical protein
VSKTNAQTLTTAALDGLKAASSEIRAKIEVLKPLQERLAATQKEVRSRPPSNLAPCQAGILMLEGWREAFLARFPEGRRLAHYFGCDALRLTAAGRKRLQEGEVRALEKELPVTSEQALNDMVKQIEYRISHEQMPLAEEKLLVRVHCFAVEGWSPWLPRHSPLLVSSPLASASCAPSTAVHAGTCLSVWERVCRFDASSSWSSRVARWRS